MGIYHYSTRTTGTTPASPPSSISDVNGETLDPVIISRATRTGSRDQSRGAGQRCGAAVGAVGDAVNCRSVAEIVRFEGEVRYGRRAEVSRVRETRQSGQTRCDLAAPNPPVLVLHLKRFEMLGYHSAKLETPVAVPSNIPIDIGKYVGAR